MTSQSGLIRYISHNVWCFSFPPCFLAELNASFLLPIFLTQLQEPEVETTKIVKFHTGLAHIIPCFKFQ